ncbi:Pimeloyl-ACP methyl ester carboxylesterase [Rhizobiales bacterium GAS188]|nr:Pimeloyl-ACP methyl ester carboxylesterase [Rhizobiales bacterium GAS188]
MPEDGEADGFRSVFVSAGDGLRLHLREYGERHWSPRPVLCLPGLARTSADFHELALRLSTDARTPRRVIACDMRGRGQSQYDADPANYDVAVEAADILAIAAAMGLDKPVFIGASRGGLQIMVLAAMRPTVIGGAVLVDIGPVIDGKGLARIKGYVGKLPAVRDLDEAAAMLQRIGAAQFPAWSDAQWQLMAERSFKRTASGLVPDYDPALAATLAAIDLETKLPTLWPFFEALASAPLFAVRGETSDILSPATLAEMGRRHPACETLTIAGEGHAPDVGSPLLAERIAAFVASCDRPRAG